MINKEQKRRIKMEFTLETEAYNNRRYGRPWIAIVDFGNDATGDFAWGTWTGDHYKGGEGVLTVTAYPGDIIAEGQKDNRKPRNSERNYYILLESGKLDYLGDKADAYKHYLAQKKEVAAKTETKKEYNNSLAAQAMRRAWEIRKEAARKFDCKVSEIEMSACMKQAWAEVKENQENCKAMFNIVGMNQKRVWDKKDNCYMYVTRTYEEMMA
jgi:hypothetical protein